MNSAGAPLSSVTTDMSEPHRFRRPTSNYFRMPNEWTDITASINSIAELKVIEYVIRHTWGFSEYGIAKLITGDEFSKGRLRRDGTRMDRGTGLSEPAVREGLKRAVADGWIIEEIDNSDRGRIRKSYYLDIEPDSETVDNSQDVEGRFPTPRRKIPTLTPQETYPRTKKDTLEKNHEKNMVPTGTQSNDPKTNWKAELAATLTESNYRRWIVPLELVELVNHHAVLSAPDAGTADYARTRLADTLARALNVEGIEVRAAK